MKDIQQAIQAIDSLATQLQAVIPYLSAHPAIKTTSRELSVACLALAGELKVNEARREINLPTDTKQIIAVLLDQEDVTVHFNRSVFEMGIEENERGRHWLQTRVGSLYIVICCGGEEVSVINGIRAALGHPMETFGK